MFNVKIIGGGLIYKVYAVREKENSIEFLLYHHRHKWYWECSSKFEPIL